jgi:hypothetical protein
VTGGCAPQTYKGDTIVAGRSVAAGSQNIRFALTAGFINDDFNFKSLISQICRLLNLVLRQRESES